MVRCVCGSVWRSNWPAGRSQVRMAARTMIEPISRRGSIVRCLVKRVELRSWGDWGSWMGGRLSLLDSGFGWEDGELFLVVKRGSQVAQPHGRRDRAASNMGHPSLG